MKKVTIGLLLVVLIWVSMAVGRTYLARKEAVGNLALFPERLGVSIAVFKRLIKECEFDEIDFEQFVRNPFRGDIRIAFFLRPKAQFPYAAAVAIREPERGWRISFEDWYLKR